MRPFLSRGVSLLPVLVVVAACHREQAPVAGGDTTAAATTAAASTAPPVVTITASDYAFDAPAQIPAGRTTFRIVSTGKELHHATLIRLDAGHTAEEFAVAIRKPGPPPSWASPVGGPNAPVPDGGTAEVTEVLTPGAYVIACFIPSPDGVLHIAKGMMRALTVTPSTAAESAEPNADATVTLAEYTFTVSAPLAAGHRVLRVRNDGTQPHEVELVRLDSGKTGEQMAAWVDSHMHGPPPGMPMGGVAALAPGDSSFFLVDLAPGNYAFLCFVADAKDGKEHTAHGMIKDFTVGAGA